MKHTLQSQLEFILLSDTLGVSTLVDALNNAKPPHATESTVLGPFFTDDAHDSTLDIPQIEIYPLVH